MVRRHESWWISTFWEKLTASVFRAVKVYLLLEEPKDEGIVLWCIGNN